MKARPAVLTLATVLAANASSLSAHDTWALPDRFEAAPGEEIVFALSSGMEFPKNDHAVAADRVEAARLRLAGKTHAIGEMRAEADHLALRARPAAAGVAGFALSSKPREITLRPDQVKEYFEEIGAAEAARRAWESSGAKELRELYRKHATTFVRVGDAGADDSFGQPLSLDFELVPGNDPTRLSAGARLAFVARFRGAPLAGASVTLVAAGGKHTARVETDAAGKAAVELPSAGHWLLKAVHLRPPVDATSPWTSDFTTFAFEVSAAAPKSPA